MSLKRVLLALAVLGLSPATASAQEHHTPFALGDHLLSAVPRAVPGRYPQPDTFGSPIYLYPEAGQGLSGNPSGLHRSYAFGEAAVDRPSRDAKGGARADRRPARVKPSAWHRHHHRHHHH